jgi:hypothetical protein
MVSKRWRKSNGFGAKFFAWVQRKVLTSVRYDGGGPWAQVRPDQIAGGALLARFYGWLFVRRLPRIPTYSGL